MPPRERLGVHITAVIVAAATRLIRTTVSTAVLKQLRFPAQDCSISRILVPGFFMLSLIHVFFSLFFSIFFSFFCPLHSKTFFFCQLRHRTSKPILKVAAVTDVPIYVDLLGADDVAILSDSHFDAPPLCPKDAWADHHQHHDAPASHSSNGL